jgi:2-phospho-L-lactate guanylyltransferase
MSLAPTIAIVPVKGLDQAKSRLAGRLNPAARHRLVLAMLADVLTALRGCAAVNRTIVVTPDHDVAAAARDLGAEALMEDEPSGNLNVAIGLAIDRASRDGAARALIVPADVPRATAAEFDVLLATAERTGAAVAVVPSHDGRGTNALVLRPTGVLAPAFGPNSCQRHLSEARSRSLARRVIELPGLSFDVDETSDLDRLLELARYSWLQDLFRTEGTADTPQRPALEVNEDKP